jgi:hypothetical protein
LQKILHEEQNNSAEEGWSFVKRTESCEIWRKNERDKPVHLIKVGERGREAERERERVRGREMSLLNCSTHTGVP